MGDHVDDDDELLLLEQALQLVDDKLFLLDQWLDSDPKDDDLNFKKEEYLGLLEELQILQKKLAKTYKILSSDSSNAKVKKKQAQYVREISDIFHYMDHDDFFETTMEEEAEKLANSLSGKPLETLMEDSQRENSLTLDGSQGIMSDWGNQSSKSNSSKGSLTQRHPSRSNSYSSGSLSPKDQMQQPQSQSKNSGNFNNSTASLELDDLKPPAATRRRKKTSSTRTESQRPNPALIRKKLKKVIGMIKQATSEKQLRKLEKKRDQYLRELGDDEEQANYYQETSSTDGSFGLSGVSGFDSSSDDVVAQEEEVGTAILEREVPLQRPRKPAPSHVDDEEDNERLDSYTLLKKKLAKAEKLVQAASSETKALKMARKIEEYLCRLSDDYGDWWSVDRVELGYAELTDAELANHEAKKEQRLAEQQVIEAERLRFEEEKRHEAKVLLSAQHRLRENVDEEGSADLGGEDDANGYINGGGSSSRLDQSIILERDEMEKEIFEEERKSYSLLRKKLKKVNRMLDELVEALGEEEAEKSKQYKKLNKKRKEYLATLNEYSLGNSLSLNGSELS